MTEDEVFRWHHRLNGHESDQTEIGEPGVLQSTGSPRVGHDLAAEQQQYIKRKSFRTAKQAIANMKRQSTRWEKVPVKRWCSFLGYDWKVGN